MSPRGWQFIAEKRMTVHAHERFVILYKLRAFIGVCVCVCDYSHSARNTQYWIFFKHKSPLVSENRDAEGHDVATNYRFRVLWLLHTPAKFDIQQFCVLPQTVYLCVLYGSENEQRLFPYTALIAWFVERRRSVLTARYELRLYI